ncbi:MAG TPA: BlaI/MecI/CopY family transcriptional regulator [Anaerolineae bacterium]|nr:BlaI/MecI/CopY family transcriptional regulator [Anaerolineae bacterium]HOQ97511.1 BlaI/MecI/CopY family transcriptional regulator [Anaerolineae bacterium]HPL28542.1 BlaI/MecI/CopY family transcriptional regulator [Anaerolineae bacterium]
MDRRLKRLPDAELEIMLIVWKAAAPVNSTYILEQLQGQRTWALATLMTVLARLVEKGFLVCEKQGRNNLYRAAIGEDEYKQSEGRTILEKLYGNSIQSLVTALYDGRAIDKDDLVELRRLLDSFERED